MKDLFSPRIPDFIYIYRFPEVNVCQHSNVVASFGILAVKFINCATVFFVLFFFTPTTRIHSQHSKVCVIMATFLCQEWRSVRPHVEF